MVYSRPNSNTLFAVAFFLVILLGVDVWILVDLIQSPETYFIWKIILTPALFAIAIIVSVKSYFRALTLSLGKDKIAYRFPFGRQKVFRLESISSYDEEVIKRKGSTYKELSISLKNGKRLSISNQENSNYDQVVKYLQKKVRVRK